MRKPRGGAMLAALIVIGVISLVTVATLQLANISKQQASKDARNLSQMACVEAARQYVLSRLRLTGAPTTSITLDQAVQVGSGATTAGLSGNLPFKRLRTGHVTEKTIDLATGKPINDPPKITSVTPIGMNLVSQVHVGERSNVVGSVGLSGRPFRAVVACTDPQAGDMELEFTFQFGQ
ncbi:MAG: hypothetical protein ACJ79W_01865 [Myxococcales bacterium]